MCGSIEREVDLRFAFRSSDCVWPGSLRTCAGSFFGVWSAGAGASVPWNVEPTTTVTIACSAFARSAGGSFATSASPNRSATFRAAAFAPACLGSK